MNTTSIGADDLGPFVSGAVSLEPGTFGGVVPHRLPAWARAQTDDTMFAFAEASPTGVSLRFASDADQVTLTIAARTVAAVGTEPAPLPVVVRRSDGTVAVIAGPEPTLILLGEENAVVGTTPRGPQAITIPTPSDDVIEILLPHAAQVELIELRADGPLHAVPDSRPRWVHYGSSISQGLYSTTPTGPWPVTVAHTLDWSLHNFSFAGNAQLDGFVARVLRDTPADLITLKVGINIVNADSMRERAFRPALHGFLDTVREGHPRTPITLISAVACPLQELTPGPVFAHADGSMRTAQRRVIPDVGALTLMRTREVVEAVALQRADAHLAYLDGRELFGYADATKLYDGLHPDQSGLDLIAERFIEQVRSGGIRTA